MVKKGCMVILPNGFLFLCCDHEANPKSIDPSDTLAPCPIAIEETCDFWKGKNSYIELGGFPQICFNCEWATAMLITNEDLYPDVPKREL